MQLQLELSVKDRVSITIDGDFYEAVLQDCEDIDKFGRFRYEGWVAYCNGRCMGGYDHIDVVIALAIAIQKGITWDEGFEILKEQPNWDITFKFSR